MKAQYAILRFAKYKGPEIGRIEAHNERTKEAYASNPDVDLSRSEIKAFFETALDFMKQKQDPKTFISAVVHMDEKTPHMHFSFVPLTQDRRLSAKDILGNKKKLSQWQDKFWAHMVAKYPDLERGLSASETGRDHIPPRLFKEMTRLTKQRTKLEALLSGANTFNAKGRLEEIAKLLDRYIPGVEQMDTALKKYRKAFLAVAAENQQLKEENAQLSEKSVLKKMQELQLQRDYKDALALLRRIPPDVLAYYKKPQHERRQERE